jgi:hypothetical protein
MGTLPDYLVNAGFKPTKSTEGEFQPLEGIYAVQFAKADEMPANDKGGRQLYVAFKVTETLKGKESKSQYNEFKKYLALEGELKSSDKKGIGWIVNALFTAGVEVSGTTEEELIVSIKNVLGTTLYVSARGWTPPDGDKAVQLFNVMKESIALKKAQDKK